MRIHGTYINLNLPDVDELQFVEKQWGRNWNWNGLPHIPGIYFFSDGDEILYVGESRDINYRLRNHHRLNSNIIRIYFLPLVDGEEMERILLEKAYIMGLKPRLNREKLNLL